MHYLGGGYDDLDVPNVKGKRSRITVGHVLQCP